MADDKIRAHVSKEHQHSENKKFLEYIQQLEKDKKHLEFQPNTSSQFCQRHNIEIEKKAMAKRHQEMQSLNEIKKVCKNEILYKR